MEQQKRYKNMIVLNQERYTKKKMILLFKNNYITKVKNRRICLEFYCCKTSSKLTEACTCLNMTWEAIPVSYSSRGKGVLVV